VNLEVRRKVSVGLSMKMLSAGEHANAVKRALPSQNTFIYTADYMPERGLNANRARGGE
jgi:hypothetical protein